MDPYRIILRPLITEKGTGLNERLNQYAFEVHPDTNKEGVTEAIKAIYGVRVTKVRTQNMKGKTRRFKMAMGRTKHRKKAIVTLHEEDRIDLF